MATPHTVSRFVLAICFIVAGTIHLFNPAPFLAIMPPYIPWPETMVTISGISEILGGVGICFPITRVAAGWGLIALLIAVFPANIHAIFRGMMVAGHAVPNWMLWARLPFQLLFVAWVYWVAVRAKQNVSIG